MQSWWKQGRIHISCAVLGLSFRWISFDMLQHIYGIDVCNLIPETLILEHSFPSPCHVYNVLHRESLCVFNQCDHSLLYYCTLPVRSHHDPGITDCEASIQISPEQPELSIKAHVSLHNWPTNYRRGFIGLLEIEIHCFFYLGNC